MTALHTSVLVTGAGGQLGHALCRRVPDDVVLHARDRAALDITDEAAVARCLDELRPDWIINAAAYTAVDAAEEAPERAFAVNRDGPTHLATAAAALGARLLHVSTDYVFDGRQGRPYGPGDVPRPLNVYGRSKREGEEAVLAALGDRALIVRTAWLYSAGGGNFVHTLLRILGERDSVTVVEDQVGSPTWVDDLAAALWASIERRLAGLHHWTNAGVASWYDFAVAIGDEAVALGLLPRAAAVVPIPTSRYPLPASRPTFAVLDCDATRAALGEAVPQRHWRAALRAMLRTIVS